MTLVFGFIIRMCLIIHICVEDLLPIDNKTQFKKCFFIPFYWWILFIKHINNQFNKL